MRKRSVVLTITFVTLLGAGLGTYYKYFRPRPTPAISEATVTSGSILEIVKATGTLMPTRTVDVGTQVSGTVQKLFVDFDSIVKKGQLLAVLDPTALQEALDSMRAAADQAQIALAMHELTRESDRTNLERERSLFADGIATQQDLDDASVAVKADDVQNDQDRAAVAAANLAVRQAQVNLAYCTVAAPVDGVVISRNVDAGQTVSARMDTPSLYLLATDLSHLQMVADVDEAAISRLQPGQLATFAVDAYPMRFSGTVSEVRLNATTINSVVTFQTIITVPNNDLRLLPGMTAMVSIETGRADEAVRIPNRALRFQPTAAMFSAFGQPVPPAPPASANAGTRAAGAPAAAPADLAGSNAPATIDASFKPEARTRTAGQVWVLEGNRLVRVPVELGITDGTWTQMISGDVQPGEEIVGSMAVRSAAPR